MNSDPFTSSSQPLNPSTMFAPHASSTVTTSSSSASATSWTASFAPQTGSHDGRAMVAEKSKALREPLLVVPPSSATTTEHAQITGSAGSEEDGFHDVVMEPLPASEYQHYGAGGERGREASRERGGGAVSEMTVVEMHPVTDQ